MDETVHPDLSYEVIINKSEERGDVFVRGFWDRRKDSILNVRITDLDSDSYIKITLEAIIREQDNEEKNTMTPA